MGNVVGGCDRSMRVYRIAPAHEVSRLAAMLTDAELLQMPLAELMTLAGAERDLAYGRRVTYSPKVFIPLTMLCRDRCGYCTFAKAPARLASPYLSLDEVLGIARAGRAAGCHEALFTLGEEVDHAPGLVTRGRSGRGVPHQALQGAHGLLQFVFEVPGDHMGNVVRGCDSTGRGEGNTGTKAWPARPTKTARPNARPPA